MDAVGILSLVAIALCSCEKEDELEQQNSLFGWYYDGVDSHEFISIDVTILRGEYSRSDFFYDSGRFYNIDYRYIDEQINVVNIVNKNTLKIGNPCLYDPSYVPSSWTIVARIYGGTYLGELVYAENTFQTYTYEKDENKIYVSNGDIYTIGNGTLIKDGSSVELVKIELGQEVAPPRNSNE